MRKLKNTNAQTALVQNVHKSVRVRLIVVFSEKDRFS